MMRKRLRHLPLPIGVSVLLLAGLAVVGGWRDGSAGALGAAGGVALVLVSYVLSSVVLAWADSVNPRLVMSVGLVTYATKFSLLGLVVFAVAALDWSGQRMFAIGIIVGTVTWVTAQAWWTFRARIPYVEIDPR